MATSEWRLRSEREWQIILMYHSGHGKVKERAVIMMKIKVLLIPKFVLYKQIVTDVKAHGVKLQKNGHPQPDLRLLRWNCMIDTMKL